MIKYDREYAKPGGDGCPLPAATESTPGIDDATVEAILSASVEGGA